MSPEQARGDPVDQTTDLFSLGSVLYAMCTGQPPFRSDSTMAVLRRVSDEAPRPLCELNPDVPEWLAAIISKLMAKVPAERFQSATELADALAGHLDEPKQPSRTSFRPAADPTARRPLYGRPIGVVASMLGLIATAIGLLSWWRFHSADPSGLSDIPVAIPPIPSSPPDRPALHDAREVVKAVSRSGHVQNFL